MKQTKNESTITCHRCHREIFAARLAGISLLCPDCGKPCDTLFK